jgi:hypothetical protein
MDPTHDDELTPALSAAKQRRLELHDALVGVEEISSSAAAGRVGEWAGAVAKSLLHLRDAFEEHVITTEGPDGLYEEIFETAPRLAGNVRRLREEHVVIREAIEGQLERFSSPPGDEEALDQARDELQRLLGQIVRHRQHGADLVWEAYNLDIGGTG